MWSPLVKDMDPEATDNSAFFLKNLKGEDHKQTMSAKIKYGL